MAEALEPLGITHVQFVLLASTWWLCENAEPPRQRDLAEHAGTDPMMTSQVVRALEAKGLLVRGVDPDDRRAWRLTVTREGSTLRAAPSPPSRMRMRRTSRRCRPGRRPACSRR